MEVSITSGVGTASTGGIQLRVESGSSLEMFSITSVVIPNTTVTVRKADEAGQPQIKKCRLASLVAPSNDVVLDMCQRISEARRTEEETRRAEIAKRSVPPQSTTSTYASHARKYVVFRTVSGDEGNVDMFLEGLSVVEQTKG